MFWGLSHFSVSSELDRCRRGLRRGEQYANLGLHRLERFDQGTNIHSAYTCSVEQQATLDSEHAQTEYNPLTNNARNQFLVILHGMDYQELASCRDFAEIVAKTPQIAPKDLAALTAQSASQPRRKPRLPGEETEVIFF
jgi:hypothetical protein